MIPAIPLEQSFHFNLFVFAKMSPCYRRIACVFTTMYTATLRGHQKESFWCREKIAKAARCSIGEVSRFISKYKFIFKSVEQPKSQAKDGKVKYFSNRYKFTDHFFTLVWFLKKEGYAKHWNIHGDRLMKEVDENEDLAMQKIGYDFRVMNNQCAHDPRLKTHTKDLMNSSNSNYKSVPETTSVPFKYRVQEELKKSLGLSESQFSRLQPHLSSVLTFEILDDVRYCEQKGVYIRTPERWAGSRLIAHAERELAVLRRIYNPPRRRAA